MNTRSLISIAAPAMAACLCFLPNASHGVGMRWHVDVTGLEATTSTGIFEPDPPPPVLYVANVHGYFDADDSNGDGRIVQSEVLAIQPMPGTIFPSAADTLVSFTYDPAVGLSYVIDGYRYRVDFGQTLSFFSDISSTTYRWVPSTLTTIGSPVPIPEVSRLAMWLAGLGVLGLVAANRRI